MVNEKLYMTEEGDVGPGVQSLAPTLKEASLVCRLDQLALD